MLDCLLVAEEVQSEGSLLRMDLQRDFLFCCVQMKENYPFLME